MHVILILVTDYLDVSLLILLNVASSVVISAFNMGVRTLQGLTDQATWQPYCPG